MRINGTKYPSIEVLPKNAIPVSTYGYINKMAVGHIYTKYKRYYDLGTSKSKPDYIIRCYMGSNFVIPN